MTRELEYVATLRNTVQTLERLDEQYWLTRLEKRKLREMEFHDRHRSGADLAADQDTFDKFYGNKKYYRIAMRSRSYTERWIAKEAKGRVFLDYACGNGERALLASKSGSLLSLGLDISPISIANARRIAKESGVDAVHFFQADAENTHLPDNSVDRIVCSGVLHHLDLSYAFPELRRILRPGGKILAIEALKYNPALRLYRKLTPHMRTEWESQHILGLRELEFARWFFDIGEVRFWHVVGYAAGKFPSLLPLLDRIDQLLERVPGIRLMAWMFTFELISKKEQNP